MQKTKDKWVRLGGGEIHDKGIIIKPNECECTSEEFVDERYIEADIEDKPVNEGEWKKSASWEGSCQHLTKAVFAKIVGNYFEVTGRLANSRYDGQVIRELKITFFRTVDTEDGSEFFKI